MSLKKIEYLIPELIQPFIKENYPDFVELLKLFGKYLDLNNYRKILKIEDNLTNSDIYSELLDYFLTELLSDSFNYDTFDLNDKNKKRLIDFAIKINRSKGNKESFAIVFQLLSNFSLITSGGVVDITDLGEMVFGEFSEPENILQYYFSVKTTSTETVESLLPNVHPAGILYNIVPIIYDGTYYYDGTISYNGELIGTFIPYFGFLEDTYAYGFGNPDDSSVGGHLVS